MINLSDFTDTVTTTGAVGDFGFHMGSFLVKPEYRKFLKTEDLIALHSAFTGAMTALAANLNFRKSRENVDPDAPFQLPLEGPRAPGELYSDLGYCLDLQTEAKELIHRAERYRDSKSNKPSDNT